MYSTEMKYGLFWSADLAVLFTVLSLIHHTTAFYLTVVVSKLLVGAKILPRISTLWTGRNNVTDEQTTDRQTDGLYMP